MIYFERTIIDRESLSAGVLKPFDLPTDNPYRGLWLTLKGNVATGATAPAGLKSHAEHRLLKNIAIVANGKDTIVQTPGLYWKLRNTVDFGTEHVKALIGTTANTSYDFEANVYIPFVALRGRRPIDAILDARKLSSLQLQLTMGSINDVYGTPNNASLSNLNITVHSEEYVNAPADLKAFVMKHWGIIQEVVSSTTELEVKLPSDAIYRRLLIYAEADDVANEAIINKIGVKYATFTYKQVKADYIQRKSKLMNTVETLPQAVYPISFITDGMLSESINVKGAGANFKLVFDVSKQAGTNKIYIFAETLWG